MVDVRLCFRKLCVLIVGASLVVPAVFGAHADGEIELAQITGDAPPPRPNTGGPLGDLGSTPVGDPGSTLVGDPGENRGQNPIEGIDSGEGGTSGGGGVITEGARIPGIVGGISAGSVPIPQTDLSESGWTPPSANGDGWLANVTGPTWAFITGIASILSVFVALYRIQLQPIPPSEYRARSLKKTLMLSGGIGLLVFSGVMFYSQYPPPGEILLRKIYALLHGVDVMSYYYSGLGSSVWGILIGLGALLIGISIGYDPFNSVRDRLIEQLSVIEEKKKLAVRNLPQNHTEEEFIETLFLYRAAQLRLMNLLAGEPQYRFEEEISDKSASAEQTEGRPRAEVGDETKVSRLTRFR